MQNSQIMTRGVLYLYDYYSCCIAGQFPYCRSPDFKKSIGQTKNLDRHYKRVVVCSVGWLFATLVITKGIYTRLLSGHTGNQSISVGLNCM